MYTDYYLEHHGIKGQKWGVRRFQNEDGTRTDAGLRREKQYRDGEITNRDYRKLKRDVRHLKKSVGGSGNQFAWDTSTGKYSDKVLAKKKEVMKKADTSKEIREFDAKIRKLDSLVERGKIDPNEYDERYEKLRDELLKTEPMKERSRYSGDRVLGEGKFGSGRINGYTKEYLENGGKDITVARLKDLGYEEEGAEYVASILIKKGRVLE